jgi:histidyl-tRNA synthetase
MTDTISAIKGMDDLFEADLQDRRFIEDEARANFLAFGFGEIRTPIVEETALFVRGVGQGSDIVHKEMYAFEDRGRDDDKGTSICLRPENTAGVVRAMLQAGKIFADAYEKLFYLGPMFRREQPQLGRRRQFHQLGCEALGYAEPGMDVEVMALVHVLLTRLGLAPHVKLLINSLGDAADRPAYNAALVAYFEQHRSQLSEDSRRRLSENPLRILDSKDPGDQALVAGAPRSVDHLSDEARTHFAAVQAGLTRLGIPFVVDTALVRGLDYYSRTVFEFVGATGLGAQSAVAAGGRYDGLVQTLGGRPTPAVGFASGIERLLLMRASLQLKAAAVVPSLMLVGADDDGRATCERLAHGLRMAGIRVAVDVRGRGMKAQLKSADKLGAIYVAVVGSQEVATGEVTLKRLADGDTSTRAALTVDGLRAKLS